MAKTAQGVAANTPVLFAGTQVGKVVDVSATADEQARIEIEITSRHDSNGTPLARPGVVFAIKTDPQTHEKSIEMTNGDNRGLKEELKSGQVFYLDESKGVGAGGKKKSTWEKIKGWF